ncbi:MAG: class I SAM-dependent methyltransferase [Nanoarchaeota archaeon]|nr:class I SAM-dependent methyltransferase [Nanoarchaeota archaeon]
MPESKSINPTYWDKVYLGFHQEKPFRASVWNEEPTSFFVRLIPFLKYKGIQSILDAGCGDGRNLTPLIESGFDVIGVDSSEEALHYAKHNNADARNLKLYNSSLYNIDLLDNSMDALICDHVLTHIEEPDKAINEFYRLINSNGYALLEFTSKQDSTFGKGKKISDNEFLQNGVYLRYDEPADIQRMLKGKFQILCFTSEHSTDPPHGKGYIREERHNHHSYFVVARKE